MKTLWTTLLIAVVFSACAGQPAIEGVEEFNPGGAGDHRDGKIEYQQLPPIGGAHNARWQGCGVYTQPVMLEQAVHSLEHGAVWISYKPDLSPTEVAQLTKLVQTQVILAPYPAGTLSKPIEVVSWGRRLRLDRADDPRLEQFILRYANDPKAPEPGQAC